jgi:putative ABC transport system permease protein
MEALFQDIRFAVRALVKSPTFTVAAVVALALGIGANTAIFSVVNGVLLKPLPYADESRLVVILHDARNPVAVANYVDWKAQSRAYEAMGAADYWMPDLTGAEEGEKLWALRMTADVLPMLGVEPMLGRVFRSDEEAAGRNQVAVIGYGLWQRRFASDPNALGRTITLDGRPYTVIGVMPRAFRFAPFWATRAELWAPLDLTPRLANRGGNSLRVFARLRPGVGVQQARAEMAAITSRLEQQFPGTNRAVAVTPLKERVVGNVERPLLVLLGAVAFVLLIACANVAHMLLARGQARRREVAVRRALGADAGRIVRQLLTESLVLALLGGGVGVLLAVWGTGALVALGPAGLPRLEAVDVDARVLLASLLASLLTGVLAGLAPALQGSRAGVSEALKEGSRGSTSGPGGGRLRAFLMASEFALALVLAAGAGLMMRSFLALSAIDPGFDPKGVVSLVVSLGGSRHQASPEARFALFQQLQQRLEALPGVRSASAINHLPLAGDLWGWPFWVEGREIPRPGQGQGATYRVVLPGYFKTMGIPLGRGRDVSASDTLAAPRVVVVNEQLARRIWPGEDALGRRISLDNPSRGPATWLTVVGIAKNAKRGGWTEDAANEMYLPYLQTPGSYLSYMTLVARAEGDPAALFPALRQLVSAADGGATVSQLQTMEQVVASATGTPRFYLSLFVVFAALALTLAGVGIYGVMSYAIAQRRQEVAIRIALGARPRDVLWLVVGQGMSVAAIGGLAGLAAALALSRVMRAILYQVEPSDPATFALVALLLGLVAFLASYLPARRAARIDPLSALRHD